MNTTRCTIIGVSGGTGSGKTTVANAICDSFSDVVLIQHDSYYKDRKKNSAEEISQINFDHPNALESHLLATHLRELKKWKSIIIPQYDFASHTRSENGTITHPSHTIIVEGMLIFFEKELRDLMDVKIFVDTDDDIRFIRRLRRDITERGRTMDSVITQYIKTVKPSHIDFVEPSKKFADIIIPEGHNPIAIEMVLAFIKDRVL